MYVLPIVLILVIKRNSSLSSNWWKRQNIAKQEKYNACKLQVEMMQKTLIMNNKYIQRLLDLHCQSLK